MRERGLEFKVGLMLIAAAAVFVGFVFVLGNWSLSSGYTVYVDYDYSGNLQPGAPVKVAGMKVGKIEDVSFLGGKLDPATGRRVYVRVEAWIEDRARTASAATPSSSSTPPGSWASSTSRSCRGATGIDRRWRRAPRWSAATRRAPTWCWRACTTSSTRCRRS
jgi:hypothetical protein